MKKYGIKKVKLSYFIGFFFFFYKTICDHNIFANPISPCPINKYTWNRINRILKTLQGWSLVLPQGCEGWRPAGQVAGPPPGRSPLHSPCSCTDLKSTKDKIKNKIKNVYFTKSLSIYTWYEQDNRSIVTKRNVGKYKLEIVDKNQEFRIDSHS